MNAWRTVGSGVPHVQRSRDQLVAHQLPQLVDRGGGCERPDAQRVEEVRHETGQQALNVRPSGVRREVPAGNARPAGDEEGGHDGQDREQEGAGAGHGPEVYVTHEVRRHGSQGTFLAAPSLWSCVRGEEWPDSVTGRPARSRARCSSLSPWWAWRAAAPRRACPSTRASARNPVFPPEDRSLIPTVNVVTAKGWAPGHDAPGRRGHRVAAFARGLDHPRWLLRAAERRRAGRRDERAAAARGRQGHQGLVLQALPEEGRRRRAQREPHHAAARRRRRRRRRDAHGVPDGPELAVRHGAGRRHALRRQHRRARALPVHGRADARSRRPARRSPTFRPGRSTITGRRASSRAPTARSSTSASAPTATSPRTAWTRKRAAPRSGRSTARPAQHRVFASGLRNPVGMAWEPETGALWTAVNERDELGSDLVPDYMTSVRDGAFYGWPYSYFGQHVDTRVKPPRPDLVAQRDRARLRARARTRRRSGLAYRAATRRCRRRFARGHVRRPARLVEPQAAQRLQGDLRAVRGRQARPASPSTC